MDSLTQIVLGAAVGEAILGKKIGNRAVLYGGIIGTIPDLDVFFGNFYDPITAVEIHRGFSHSFVFFALLSPLLGLLIARLERKNAVGLFSAIWMAFLCLATHAILDAFTTWGTQLFWPHPYRAGIQSIFVIDPLYTLPFLFCLIMAMRLPRESETRRKWNRIGLWLSTGYLFLTVIVKQVTTDIFETSLATKSIYYDRLIVKPAPLNIILWNANIETAEGYWLGDYSYFDTSPIRYTFYPRGEDKIAHIKDSETIKKLIRISEGWYVITKRGDKLFFNDLRFGLLNDDVKNPEFVFSYEIIDHNGTITARESDNKGGREGMQVLKKLVERIKGR